MQLEDVAKGLEHLHKCGIIHGDLKGVRWYFNDISLFHHDDQDLTCCRSPTS